MCYYINVHFQGKRVNACCPHLRESVQDLHLRMLEWIYYVCEMGSFMICAFRHLTMNAMDRHVLSPTQDHNKCELLVWNPLRKTQIANTRHGWGIILGRVLKKTLLNYDLDAAGSRNCSVMFSCEHFNSSYKGKGKVHHCTGTEALYRPYGP